MLARVQQLPCHPAHRDRRTHGSDACRCCCRCRYPAFTLLHAPPTHTHKPTPGRDLARSVKQASRGASVNLKSEGNCPAGPRSFYKTEFCERHDKAAKELGLEANPEAYAMVSARFT